jgi:hypothetical protein
MLAIELPPPSGKVRYSSTAASELRQADVPDSYYPRLGWASGLVRVQMRRVRSMVNRIC